MANNFDNSTFRVREQSIHDCYPCLRQLTSDGNSISLDIIESYDDMISLLPLFAGIIGGRLNAKEFCDAMTEIEVRSWHLSEHLKLIFETLSGDFDLQTETITPGKNPAEEDEENL